MRLLALVFIMVVLFPIIDLADAEEATKEGPRIYMPYARSKDHMVVGKEIPGYHMRYDIAQSSNIFMIILPDGFDDMNTTPVYFSIDTFALGKYTVKETFEGDIKTLTKNNPGLKVIRKFNGKKLSKAGECYGAEFEYAKDRAFPYEIFYFCKNKSAKYSILLSIGARDNKSLDKHLPNFIKWANAPQIVTDYKVTEIPDKK